MLHRISLKFCKIQLILALHVENHHYVLACFFADQVSCLLWLLHEDLHEIKITAALEYLSSMVASVEPIIQPINGQRFNSEAHPSIEQNFLKGKFHVRLKTRNGRVRLMVLSHCFLQSRQGKVLISSSLVYYLIFCIPFFSPRSSMLSKQASSLWLLLLRMA